MRKKGSLKEKKKRVLYGHSRAYKYVDEDRTQTASPAHKSTSGEQAWQYYALNR